MKHTEYHIQKTKLESEIKELVKKLDALNIVWQMLGEPILAEKGKPDIAEGSPFHINYKKPKKFTPAVREIVGQHSGKFTTKDVCLWIKEARPEFGTSAIPSTVSNILMRMTRKKVIEIIQHGSGSSPTIYFKNGVKVETDIVKIP